MSAGVYLSRFVKSRVLTLILRNVVQACKEIPFTNSVRGMILETSRRLVFRSSLWTKTVVVKCQFSASMESAGDCAGKKAQGGIGFFNSKINGPEKPDRSRCCLPILAGQLRNGRLSLAIACFFWRGPAEPKPDHVTCFEWLAWILL